MMNKKHYFLRIYHKLKLNLLFKNLMDMNSVAVQLSDVVYYTTGNLILDSKLITNVCSECKLLSTIIADHSSGIIVSLGVLLFIGFSGTDDYRDFIDNLKIIPTKFKSIYSDKFLCNVHTGFYEEYSSIKYKILNILWTLLTRNNKFTSLIFFGHSSGAVSASMLNLDLSYIPQIQVSNPYLLTFGMPRWITCDPSKERSWSNFIRFIYNGDPVTAIPHGYKYTHFGNAIYITNKCILTNNSITSINFFNHRLNNYKKCLSEAR